MQQIRNSSQWRRTWSGLALWTALLGSLALGRSAVAEQILTPAGWGEAASSGHYMMVNAFGGNPAATWDGTQVTGGVTGYASDSCVQAYEPNGGVGYIDFGPNWQNLRITQTWTRYAEWTTGPGGANCQYAELWWDSNNNAVKDGTWYAETTLNFNTQAHDTTGGWKCDRSGFGEVAPRAQYLMLKLKDNRTDNNPIEYAIVGHISDPTNALPYVNAGPSQTIQYPATATLSGSMWDDGKPNPPGAVTTTWSKLSGPGTVTFSNPNILSPIATFQTEGVYVLRLSADDGGGKLATSEVTIFVNSATRVLTPAAYGQAGTSGHIQMQYAFNSQGTWNGSAVTGGGADANYCMLGSETDGGVGYIDLGNDWAKWRISQVWTKYGSGKAGVAYGTPYVELWWDNDNDAVKDTGAGGAVAETILKFNSQNHDTSGAWVRDVLAGTAVQPKGRYLMCKLRNTTQDNWPIEYALVGNIDYSPTNVTMTMPEVKAFNYANLTLVDEVNCGSVPPTAESNYGDSQTQTILGSSCRVLPNPVGSAPRYFAYRLGVGKNLQAGRAYVLVVEYPEDQPRTTIVMNRGCETTRTFHTGITTGDSLNPPYEHSRPDSLHYGLSQQYRTMEQLFHLHTRFPGVQQPRSGDPDYGSFGRPDTPASGFLVMIAQFKNADCPESTGAAVRRIALYEAPAMSAYTQTVPTLPNNLPKRRLFWREEMADDCIDATTPGADAIDWYEYKARLAKFLGMNTFSKDLLEFGFNQGWDGGKYANWYTSTPYDDRWGNILLRLTYPTNYGLDILPYYEYAGATAAGALGTQKRSKPLYDNQPAGLEGWYTGIPWCENFNVDLADSATTTDAQQVLECTVTDLASERPIPLTGDQANRLEAWDTNKWFYIDFNNGGTQDYHNVQIKQTWTRSRIWANPSAPSPFAEMKWNSTPTTSGGTPETRFNFITKTLSATNFTWQFDTKLTTAITPPARYLMMRSNATSLSQANQLCFAGYLNGGSQLQTIPVMAYDFDPVNAATSLPKMFNQQPVFNPVAPTFAGAWFRPRPGQMPIGFGDTTRELFRVQANGGVGISKQQLQTDFVLLQRYIDWWMGKRHTFMNSMRDYMRANSGNSSAVVLYDWDPTESGQGLDSPPAVVTDDTATWRTLLGTGPTITDYYGAVANHMHLTEMTTPKGFYQWQEIGYASPWPDPTAYQSSDGTILTHTINKLYSVSDPTTWDTFKTGSGIAAIRHFSLNEHAMGIGQTSKVGYFVTDADLAGPYSVICEARAVANGDVFYIGYLSSNSFNRCSPGYVRDFNANYLALPALASTVATGAANDGEVIVRRINTPSSGTYLAIVNTSIYEKTTVQITPPVSGAVTDAVTGATIPLSNGKIVLDMWPGRLKAVRIN